MPSNWYLMNNNYYSGFEKEIIDEYAIDGFNEILNNSPEAKDILIDKIDYKGVVQHLNDNNEIKELRKLLVALDTTISRGSIIEFDSEYYINITDVDNKIFYKSCKIMKCNNTLNWQDENLEEKSTPCILLNKTFFTSDGIDETKYLNLSEDQILIIIPKNNDTIKIQLDDRFIFDNSENAIYKITKVDFLTQPGLINLTMKKDSLQESDRLDLNIANYQEAVVADIQGSDTIKLYNQEIYTIDVDVAWSISNSNVSIVSQDSRNITLKGEIMGSVVLTANDGTNEYNKTIYVTNAF